jgi:hypothetical protein
VGVDVETTALIRRPLPEVADFASEPANAPAWYVNIASVELHTEPPVRVGTRAAFVAHFLGRRLAYTYEVVAYEPSRSLVMRTAEGPFPMETSYRWEAEGPELTRMWLRNRGEPAGFSRVFAPMMAWSMRRANQADLAALAALLEARPR